MSAALPTQGGLPQKTDADYPTRFVDIKPGSTIRVGGPRVGGPPFEALVLQAKEEWGATGEPALYVARTSDREELWISQAAQYEVTIVGDASIFLSDALPENAVRVKVKPVTGVAIQFKGGIESATEIIRWALGKHAPMYDRGDDTREESIVFSGIGGEHATANPGDWVIIHDEDDSVHIHRALDDYEEIL
jgi:hypothetical protein